MRDASDALDVLRVDPCGARLLDAFAPGEGVHLVGGAVRDLLLGLEPPELDVVVAADAPSFAADLAGCLSLPGAQESATATVHDRFGTALVRWPAGRIDIATRRAETYAAPGALPQVRAGTPEQDLARRDFTVNAIAVALGGEHSGSLRAVPHAFEDLAAGLLRVLHDESFRDDPTRLFRLARYGARLGFESEAHTGELAAQALADGAVATLSGARIGTELRLALDEPDPVAALAALGALGVLAALDPPLAFTASLARLALEALPEDGRRDLLLLACLMLTDVIRLGDDAREALCGLLDASEFGAADRDRALDTALRAPGLLDRLDRAETASQIDDAVRGATLEAVALAVALADEQRPSSGAAARRWLGELRHVRLQIGGEDLLAAGVPEGPEIGRRLERALRRKLDGELSGDREAELSAAMEDA